MYFDSYYLILVVPMILFSLWAQFKVKSTYAKYSKVINTRRITGAEAANALLHSGGVTDVKIESVSGELTDHYDPKANAIRLSSGVYNSNSVAAIGIACHEAGHAMQHHTQYAPIKLRMAIIPVCSVASNIAMPLVLLGIILSFDTLAVVGVLAFAVATLFELVTLPVEFNASKRALQVIEEQNFLTQEEYSGAKKVLTAAALTYVAALAVALANLLRLMLIVGGNRRRK